MAIIVLNLPISTSALIKSDIFLLTSVKKNGILWA